MITTINVSAGLISAGLIKEYVPNIKRQLQLRLTDSKLMILIRYMNIRSRCNRTI
jgi:hypothetical protein